MVLSRIYGLHDVMQGEMVEFPGDTYGLALNLERDSWALSFWVDLITYQKVILCICTGRILEVPVGEALLGRVVDALGNPIDGKGPLKPQQTSPIEKVAPGVIGSQSVIQPVTNRI